jgi:hypothetical protein
MAEGARVLQVTVTQLTSKPGYLAQRGNPCTRLSGRSGRRCTGIDRPRAR